MTLITYAKCFVCGKEEACSEPPNPPLGWKEIVHASWGPAAKLHICSHICLLKLATDNFKSEEARLSRIKAEEAVQK